MEQPEMTPQDYLGVLKRRKWSLILPVLGVFLITAAIALLLPPVYRSSSTILIEEQEVPADFVMNTVTSYAEQRLQTINQRIMSSTRLLQIIDQLHLFPKERDQLTTEEMVEDLREAIAVEPISAEVVDRRTGRPATATIAFTVSYEGEEDPATVHRVANLLTSLFLEENLRVREQQAKETSLFLEEEANRVKADLDGIEAQIATFKEEHINELPELLQVNLQSLHSVELNLERLDEQLRSLQEREGYLQTQLANTPRDLESEDRQRLAELRMQLVHLKTRFSDSYPDVIKTKAEIAELESQLGLKQRGDDQIGSSPENPAYVNLASQLASARSELASVKQQQAELQRRAADYRRRMGATPKVEETYRSLTTRRANTQAKYDDLVRKMMEAKVSHGLEKEQKGERFTLIDPARLPEEPAKPNRLAIMLIGLVLGIGSGIGFASLREFSDQSFHSPEALSQALPYPVLAAVPEIVTEKDRTRRRKQRVLQAAAAALVLVGVLVAFHFLVMDFEVLWVKLGRRFTF